jgi:CRP-like cAMP-binding protein
MSVSSSPYTALLRKIESHIALTTDERQAIQNLPVHVRAAKAGETLLREGDRPSQCCLVLSGLVCRQKIVGEGRRQIMSFDINGDVTDLQSLHLDVMDHDVAMLQDGKVGFLPHAALRAMNERHPRIAAALWRATLIDAAIFRQWMVNVGRKSAYSRVAHLLCELVALARSVGLNEYVIEHRPTQEELGNALGLSIVHVNRTMRALREAGLVATEGRRLVVLDWEVLQSAGEFDPAYLHLKTAV